MGPTAKRHDRNDEVGMKHESKSLQTIPNPGILSRLSHWRYYSVVFGLLMPVLCLALEYVLLPALGWLPGLIFFHRFRVFGYGVVVLELIVLAVWLRFGPRLGRASAAVAGVLLAGALFAGVLGLVLLPFAILGVLALGIGLLGLVPLFTAHVYYRHGMAAYRQADSRVGRQTLIEAVLWGGALVYVLPGLIQARITLTTRAAIRQVVKGDDAASQTAVNQLQPYRWIADFDPLRRAYEQERDPERRSRIQQDYATLTGNDISEGAVRLFDYDGPERLIPR
jgi:hypothetical protein